VFVRVRPATAAEQGVGPAVQVGGSSIRLLASGSDFTFANVFSGSVGNAAIYASAVRSLLPQLLEGYNATALAYGQTGSGKTPTMLGSAAEPGLIPLALGELFELVADEQEYREFRLKASYVEVGAGVSPSPGCWLERCQASRTNVQRHSAAGCMGGLSGRRDGCLSAPYGMHCIELCSISNEILL